MQARARASQRAALAAVALCALALALVALAPSGAAAAPPQLRQFCETGSAGGECVIPRGIAVNPASGEVYVADQENNRIQKFDPWGQFLRAWGWGVADGSGEAQVCTAETGCQAGSEGGGAGQLNSPQGLAIDSQGDIYSYEVKLCTGGIACEESFNSSRIQKFDSEGEFLRAWGAGVITGGASGSGDLLAGSTEVTSLRYDSKAFIVGQTVAGAGIPAGARITAIGLGQMTLSQPATASGTEVALSVAEGLGNVPTDERQRVTIEGGPTGGSFTLRTTSATLSGGQIVNGSNQVAFTPSPYSSGTGMRVGDTIADTIAGGIPAGTTITAIDVAAGTLTMSAAATASGTVRLRATDNTAPIPHAAPASGPGSVQEALEALENVGPGGVEVTGPEGGPYEVTFGGAHLTDTNVAEMTAQDSLTPSGQVSVATELEGASAAEICTVAIDCEGGIAVAGPGKFERTGVGAKVAFDSSDTLYVGSEERIQEFDTDGNYLGDLPDPEGHLAGETVQSLATDDAGNLYLAFFLDSTSSKAGVLKLDSGGSEVCTLPTQTSNGPRGIATDAAGNAYVIDGTGDALRVRKYTPGCAEVEDSEFPLADEGLNASTGIAISSPPTCDLEGIDLFLANNPSFVRIYGPPPDITVCPPPEVAPSISESFALSVGAEEATVRALINPNFWPDTTYFVQYGDEGPCSANPCLDEAPVPPALLTTEIVSKDIPANVELEGLEPNTTYHYRFSATSSGGGPVFGADASFTTFAAPEGPDPCPNEEFRDGEPSEILPDCRAYEMASPVDKNGGDIWQGGGGDSAIPDNLDQARPDGEALTYSAYLAFGDSPSGDYSPQYLATRDPEEGWTSHGISPPRSGPTFYGNASQKLHTQSMSENLCSAFFVSDTDNPIAAGDQEGYVDLYRRRNCEPQGFDALTTASPQNIPPGTEGGSQSYYPRTQGFSADSSLTFFRANAKLTAEATADDVFQVYLNDLVQGELHLVSRLPSGAAARTNSTLGVGNETFSTGLFRDNLANAVSADGSRAFWTTTNAKPTGNGAAVGAGPGPIYVRLNPTEPQSAQALDQASGAGNLSGGSTTVNQLIAAEGKASFTAGSPEVTLLETTVGEFIPGQPVRAPTKVPNGTTILEISGDTLVLSNNATATSASFPISSRGPEPFAVGQTITGPGIPSGTTIEAAAEGSLTLSAAATQTQSGALLDAFSECTEPALACTLEVSGAVSSDPARYWGADPDGERALFSFESGAEAGNLYSFEVDTETPTLIAGGLLGVMGTSEDLSRIYFASSEDLAAGATAGKSNLYLYEEGVGIAFVAALEQMNANQEAGDSRSPISRSPGFRSSRVSPDGAVAAFTSTAPLTGFDNTDPLSGMANAEVFRYDAEVEELLCVSCNRAGARPIGKVLGSCPAGICFSTSAHIPGWEHPHHPTRALSEDGERVFFNSFDRLDPRDENEAQDVYQWEAVGKGGCDEADVAFDPEAGGCVNLISTGADEEDSEFVDASADGEDVFIRTSEGLVPPDTGSIDIYDARAGGGLASQHPDPPPAPCEGDECRGRGTDPAAPLGAGSAAFIGPPNPSGKPGKSCAALARKARRQARGANRLRARARRLARSANKSSSRRARSAQRKAARLKRAARRRTRAARRSAARAKRCRRAARAARRAGR